MKTDSGAANVIEIFSSIQGEGKYIGCRQIFIRLADCNLRCEYCDTDFRRADFCRVETAAGAMTFREMKNPVDVNQVAAIVKNFVEEVPTHSVSFTGGEPLLNWQFVKILGGRLKNLGLKIFLETNGILFDELKKISDVVDIISMDLKLPSVSGGKNFFALHKKFLKIARQKDLFIKVVISRETTDEEFSAAINLVAEISPEVLLILQPVTPVRKIQAIPAEKILSLQATALKKLSDVRIIPQAHKFISVL